MMRRCSDSYDVFDGVSEKFQEIGGGTIRRVHSYGSKYCIALRDSLGGGDEDKSFSPPYTPALKEIVEQINRPMVKGALFMLI